MAVKQTKEKPAKDKYHLRALHEEIAFYDRKLAHLLKYETFASDSERDLAAEKLNSKRNLLVRDARALIEAGIEYKPSELPLSLRTPEELAEESSRKQAAQTTQDAASHRTEAIGLSSQQPTPSLQQEIQEYLQKRHRTSAHSAAS